ncbi:lipoate--protein ligase family protein [Urbifossiella limnaea]|uniref:Octanoyltransferase LipM n=1 Tax=Urbifossiella limnaea TaxID=2528023 RepID=A0A517XPB6_9BACT|nr:lipoate--protein ligase family protein [Urbifossiella limnaea]QDU19343.1 Octanoyltransferase LipM [Urbifossiella limnaea]
MARTLRLLPFATADGATNMAADEALLVSAAAGIASLRFYTWTEPTLSLGYFQPAEARAATPGVPWVRRSTGGAAILHHHELTYALALPPAAEWHTGEPWVCRMHHLLRDELADAGLTAKAVLCGEEQKLGEVLCFLDQTAGDLLVEGSKVAGSAQRKWKGALLQHGSILLWRSPHAPHLAGINDFAGRELVAAPQLAARLAGRVAVAAGCAVETDDWTPLERARTAKIRAEKYADPTWNGKR